MGAWCLCYCDALTLGEIREVDESGALLATTPRALDSANELGRIVPDKVKAAFPDGFRLRLVGHPGSTRDLDASMLLSTALVRQHRGRVADLCCATRCTGEQLRSRVPDHLRLSFVNIRLHIYNANERRDGGLFLFCVSVRES